MNQARNYFSEINDYLAKYGMTFLSNFRQEIRINNELRQLHIYVGKHFEHFWPYLLIIVKERMRDIGINSHIQAEVEEIEIAKEIKWKNVATLWN